MQRSICLFFCITLLASIFCLISTNFLYAGKIRQAVWAGKFYPGSSSELMKTIDEFSIRAGKTKVQYPKNKTLKALILPHAGYVYSGWTAAHAHAILKNKSFNRVILMGPDHRIGFSNVAISDVSAYQTPLGNILLHADAAKLRSGSILFHANEASDQIEHSLEVVLPFLQYSLKSFTFIPMVIGGSGDFRSISERIATLLDAGTLLVASSDLSHFLPYAEAKARDEETIKMILKLEDEKLLSRKNAACGLIPIWIVINLADRLNWTPQLIHYSNSGDTGGTKNSVVGYAAIAFYGDNS